MILMGFIIYYLVLIVNPMGRILVRWKSFKNNLEIQCHPTCNRLYLEDLLTSYLRITWENYLRCVVCDVWCMMCDVWCVMCDVWCVMCDVWCDVMTCGMMWCACVWCVVCDVMCGVCGMLQSVCVWCDVNVCDVTHMDVIHMCDMTHPYVWHDSSICATWLIHMCVQAFTCKRMNP